MFHQNCRCHPFRQLCYVTTAALSIWRTLYSQPTLLDCAVDFVPAPAPVQQWLLSATASHYVRRRNILPFWSVHMQRSSRQHTFCDWSCDFQHIIQPCHVRDMPSLLAFRREHKTVLFRLSYPVDMFNVVHCLFLCVHCTFVFAAHSVYSDK